MYMCVQIWTGGWVLFKENQITLSYLGKSMICMLGILSVDHPISSLQ